MDLKIFSIPDPSGRMSRESYLFKNHKTEYDYIVNYCLENNIFDIPFKEKVYLCLNKFKSVPICQNNSCGKRVKFKNSTIGYLRFCSNKCISSDPSIKELKKIKSLEKFGAKTPAESELVKEKIKKTNNEKWGGNSPMSSEVIQEKSKKTLRKNWGVYNPSHSKDILEKRVTSFRNNIDQYKDSYRKTSIERYGVDHPWKVPEIHSLSINNSIQTKNNTIRSIIEEKIKYYKQYKLIDIEYDKFKRNVIIFCNDCGDNFNINREDFHIRFKEKTTICTKCNPLNSSVSGQQLELYRFISDNYVGDIEFNKKIIYPQEIDIYLPDLKLGFEFNGLYWHSESQKGKNYHIDKTKKCSSNGIDLLHIWEDDWVYKNEIIKSIILNRIGKIKSKVFARNCIIKLVDKSDSTEFLINNHILGDCKSNVKLGLYHDGDLVSLMCFTKRGDSYELSRFCNRIKTSVVGASSRIFKYFIRNYEFDKVISYSDNSMFSGLVYDKLGFVLIGESPINYKWVISKKRLHKSNFRKSRLVESGYDVNKSETDIMIEDIGAFKIWDCGLKKWIYNKS